MPETFYTKGVQFPFGKLGTHASAITAKQLEELNSRLNEGIKNVEIGTIDSSKFDLIPKEHLKEMRRLAQFTGSNLSVHAPMVDPSGISTREGGGGQWSEQNRIHASHQISSFLDRAAEMAKKDSNGNITENIPVVLHGGSIMAHHHEENLYRVDKEGKKFPTYRAMMLVNQDTGQLQPVQHETKIRPNGIKEDFDVYRAMESLNQTSWDDEKLKLLSYEKEKSELLARAKNIEEDINALKKSGLLDFNKEDHLTSASNEKTAAIYQQKAKEMGIIKSHISNLNHDMGAKFEAMFNKVAKTQEDRYFKQHIPKKEWEEDQEKINELKERMKDYTDVQKNYFKIATNEKIEPEKRKNAEQGFFGIREEMVKDFMANLAYLPNPQTWVPLEDFSREKTVQTISEVMFTQFKKHKDKAPMLAIENFFPDAAMSTGEELRKAIEEARLRFVERLLKENAVKSESEAKIIAQKLIGATWDVGHINQIRQAGIQSEEELNKRVIKETEDILKGKDIIKHLHLTDNFGWSDSHLPPGMGNVPLKEIMEKLEKSGFQGRGIVEVGSYVGEYKKSPTIDFLEHFESPLYTMKKEPYWKEAPYSPHEERFIEFPQSHFELYGSSFTTLPRDLGGQRGGEKSRFSNTPNQ